MIALDTNVLISLRSKDDSESQLALQALAKASAIAPLCICGAVFSELLGLPGRSSNDLRQFFQSMGVSVDWKLEENDWETAGLAYQGYVRRRRASGSGLPRRIATDFLIGAHATVRGYALLTSDKGTYRAAFPNLLIESY
jgi:predicted nucleic acid-binding protein